MLGTRRPEQTRWERIKAYAKDQGRKIPRSVLVKSVIALGVGYGLYESIRNAVENGMVKFDENIWNIFNDAAIAATKYTAAGIVFVITTPLAFNGYNESLSVMDEVVDAKGDIKDLKSDNTQLKVDIQDTMHAVRVLTLENASTQRLLELSQKKITAMMKRLPVGATSSDGNELKEIDAELAKEKQRQIYNLGRLGAALHQQKLKEEKQKAATKDKSGHHSDQPAVVTQYRKQASAVKSFKKALQPLLPDSDTDTAEFGDDEKNVFGSPVHSSTFQKLFETNSRRPSASGDIELTEQKTHEAASDVPSVTIHIPTASDLRVSPSATAESYAPGSARLYTRAEEVMDPRFTELERAEISSPRNRQRSQSASL